MKKIGKEKSTLQSPVVIGGSPLPCKGDEVYVTMKSGAIYRGIFSGYKPDGGGNILLKDVKICDRNNQYNWLICPVKEMSRKLWASKIRSIEVK